MSGHIALSRLKVAAKNWLLHSCHWEVPIVATVDGETVLVAETDEQYAAQFITACNSHADLVKALERLLAAFKGLQPFPLVVQAVAVGLVRDAEAALALATTARPERAV